MSRRLALAAAAALAFAAPAFAQQAPAAPAPAPTPAEAAQAEAEAAFEARAEAFGARMEGMQREMTAAVSAAAGDQARASTDVDAIAARYQPEADAFAAEVLAFIDSQLGAAPEEQRAQMSAMRPMMEAQIKGIPGQIKAQVLQAAAAPAVAAPPVQ